MYGFYINAGESHSGPYAYAASTLLTESSPFRDYLLQVCSVCPWILFTSDLGFEITPDILKLFPGLRTQPCTDARFYANIESHDRSSCYQA